jgi:cyanophycinase-like exopeptidase
MGAVAVALRSTATATIKGTMAAADVVADTAIKVGAAATTQATGTTSQIRDMAVLPRLLITAKSPGCHPMPPAF